MPIRYPPISAMRAIEAAARHLSYTKAAQELFVTQSAISHQVKHAEQLWGFKLFERKGRSLQLTEAGHALVPIIRDFLTRVTATVNELNEKEDNISHALNVTLLQSFALKWLIPRLGNFNHLKPEIDIWISTSDSIVDFTNSEIDVGIRLGFGHWEGIYSEHLLNEYLTPVCSPEFIHKYGMPDKPADLLDYPLLRRGAIDILPRWRDWFRDAGIDAVYLPKAAQFPETGMAVQAAIDNQGVALARCTYVVEDIKEGRLVRLFPDIISQAKIGYYFVCLQGRENEDKIVDFRKWLIQEAEQSGREITDVFNIKN